MTSPQQQAPGTFEGVVAENLATLRAWLIVVTIGLFALGGIVTWGWFKIGDVTSTERHSFTTHQATLTQEQAALNTAFSRISADVAVIHQNATKSCRVQSRGLSAQPHLTAFLTDLDKLALQPKTAAQRAQEAAEPRRVRKITAKALRELGAYVRIVRKQPAGRSCNT